MAEHEMDNRTPEQKYLSDLRSSAPVGHPIHELLGGPRHGQQRVYFHDFWMSNEATDLTTLEEILAWEPECDDTGATAVCVVENICPQWIASLGVAWQLEPDFFLDYADIQTDESYFDSGLVGYSDLCRHNFLDGMIPHLADKQTQPNRGLRRFDYSHRYGWQALSRISYYRVYKHLYLFLVDAPFLPGEPDTRWLPPSKLSLWAPHSRSPRGLPAPQLYSMASFAAFEVLQDFLHQSSSWFVLFDSNFDAADQKDLFAALPGILAQFLAAGAWKTNVEHIDRELKFVAFRDLRKPSLATNNRLHDLREDLNTLRDQVSFAIKFLSEDGTSPRVYSKAAARSMKWPAQMLPEVQDRVPPIERFLMDTFQLCMSSISVLDSQSNIQDAKRSAMLTQLATIYVPLSFVTGIWGMNIKEINDSPHPLWMFGVTLVLAVAVTVAGLLLLRHWEAVAAFLQRRRLGRNSSESIGLERPRRTLTKSA